MTQFESLSILLSALALVFQAVSVLHSLVKEKLPSTDRKTMEGNHEQDA
jgi:hypothetical protein